MSLSEDLSEPLVQQPRDTARRTLAMRIAHRNRLRAERLARLHAPATAAGTDHAAPEVPAAVAATAPARQAEISRAGPEEAPVVEAMTLVQTEAAAPPPASGGSDASDALEEFLRVLSSAAPGSVAQAPAVQVPAEVLRFQRPGPEAVDEGGYIEPLAAPVCDLDRLRGAGPGLIWALQRTGIACLDDLARLEPAALVTRLGALGRLVPAATWIETARKTARTP